LLDSSLQQHQNEGINDSLYGEVAALNALASATKGFQDLQELVDSYGMTVQGAKRMGGASKFGGGFFGGGGGGMIKMMRGRMGGSMGMGF